MAEPEIWTKDVVVFNFAFDVPIKKHPVQPIEEPNRFRLVFQSPTECQVLGRWGYLNEAMDRFQELMDSQ